MKIIAKRDENTFLVDLETKDKKGFVADTKKKIRYKPFNIHSILIRGYWESAKNNKGLIEQIRKFKEV